MPSYQVIACLIALHRLVSDAFGMLNIDGYPGWATIQYLEPKPFPPAMAFLDLYKSTTMQCDELIDSDG